MSYRLTKIYTRSGDQGVTHLGKETYSKDHPLIEAIGTVDELNSQIGFVLSFGIDNPTVATCLTQIQHDLFNLGGELFLPEKIAITPEKVLGLEQQLDAWNALLPPLTEFILPRGAPLVAACHLARTVCRRAERCLVTLHRERPLKNGELLKYLNRLGDVLFVIARVLGDRKEEILWKCT